MAKRCPQTDVAAMTAIRLPTRHADRVESHPVVANYHRHPVLELTHRESRTHRRAVVHHHAWLCKRGVVPEQHALNTACSQPSVHVHGSHFRNRIDAAFVIRSKVQPTAVPGIASQVGAGPHSPASTCKPPVPPLPPLGSVPPAALLPP